ncbi:amidohydrolase family protein, partial [Clostridioides difficile]
DVEVIDASNKLVFPGFIDAHTHLGLWEDGIGFEGADGNEETDGIYLWYSCFSASSFTYNSNSLDFCTYTSTKSIKDISYRSNTT